MSAGAIPVVVGLSAGTVSGVDVFSATLVRRLTALGWPAHVLLTRPFVKWNPMPLPADVPRETLSQDPDEPWGNRWRALIRYLADRAPCVYVPNYDYEYSCVSPRLPRSVHVVGIVHSDDPVHYEHVARLGRYWDAVVAVSPTVAAHTAALQPSLSGRLATIPYGVTLPAALPERPASPGAPLRVVYAGRLEQKQKRVLDLPPIVARLRGQGVPVELSVIGDGPSREAFVAACDGLLDGGAVRLRGTLPNHAVLEAFSAAHVVILTSAFEGLPVCLLEAMGRGCVPVVTDLRSGIPDLVADGANGFRVPVGDLDGFARRLEQLWRDDVLRRSLARRAFETVREGGYDDETMARRYVELFRRVAAQAEAGAFRRPRGRIRCPPGMPEVTWKDHLPPPVRLAVGRLKRMLRRGSPARQAAAGREAT